MTRSLRLLLLVFAVTLLMAGFVRQAVAQDTLEKAREAGSIRIGFANEAPFGFADERGRPTGEAPEIAKAIFEALGIPKMEAVLTEWASLIPGLQAGRFDVIAAGMFITPERCQQVAFSRPTYRLGQSFLVQKGNPKKLHSYDDVAKQPDVTLGIMAGAVERGYARDAGIPDGQIRIFSDQVGMVSAVRAGRVDAAALTTLSIRRMAEKAGARVEQAEPFETPEDAWGYGAFAFRPDDTALRDAFNERLDAFIGSERHLELVRPFGFSEAELPDDTTTEQLCAAG